MALRLWHNVTILFCSVLFDGIGGLEGFALWSGGRRRQAHSFAGSLPAAPCAPWLPCPPPFVCRQQQMRAARCGPHPPGVRPSTRCVVEGNPPPLPPYRPPAKPGVPPNPRTRSARGAHAGDGAGAVLYWKGCSCMRQRAASQQRARDGIGRRLLQAILLLLQARSLQPTAELPPAKTSASTANTIAPQNRCTTKTAAKPQFICHPVKSQLLEEGWELAYSPCKAICELCPQFNGRGLGASPIAKPLCV